MTRAPDSSCTVIWVEPWISRCGIDLLDEPHGAHVLHDRRVDAAVDAVAQVEQRLAQLGRLHQDIEGEVDPGAPGVGQEAGLLQLVHGELRAVVAGIEALGAEIDGVGAVGEGGPGSVEGARGGKQLWNGAVHGAQLSAGRPDGRQRRRLTGDSAGRPSRRPR